MLIVGAVTSTAAELLRKENNQWGLVAPRFYLKVSQDEGGVRNPMVVGFVHALLFVGRVGRIKFVV